VTTSADAAASARAAHLRLVGESEELVPAGALIGEALALDAAGRYGEAIASAERAVAVAAEEGSDALGSALAALAGVHWHRGALDEAERLLHDALARVAEPAEPRFRVELLRRLAALAGVRGEFRHAVRHLEEALGHARRHALLDDVLLTLAQLGHAHLALHRLEAAEDAFTEGLAIANALGGPAYRMRLESRLATLALERGDLSDAKRRCDRAAALAVPGSDERAHAETERTRGVVARESGDLGAAEAHLARARELARDAHDPELEGEAFRELAVLLERTGRMREALRAMNHAHACWARLTARHELPDAERRMARLEGDFLDVARQWGDSIEGKDVHTHGHCERVADLAGALAAKVGLEDRSLFWFRVGALLHDVGKLIVPADVLNKPGDLSDEEWAVVHQHPAAGVELLGEVALPPEVAPMVRSHHERWDGQGYPDALAGEEIPLGARILCLADVYDALTTERSYKRPFSHLEAMEIMRRQSGRQFDPRLFAEFEQLVRRGTVTLPLAGERARPARRATPAGAGAAEEDDLTGVLVRRAFVSVTAAVLAERRRTSGSASLLVIDVDQFKSVNDTYGHLSGDDALRLVANVVREHLRPGQYVGRYAGDEFVVLLPGEEPESARGLADRIRATVGTTAIPLREAPGQAMRVTLSIGVATAPQHGESFEALFTAADRALFDAKREGRDRVTLAGAAPQGPPQLGFSRFVGRTAEMRALVTALDQSVQGLPQVQIVVGEAGVGKSTLLRQLLPEARLRGATMVTGRALETETQVPYGPWADVVLALREQGLAPQRPWPMLERLVPALGAGAATAAPLDGAQGPRLMQEIVAFVRGASAVQPIGLVLEDMHWADAASWDVLEHVLAQLGTDRVFVTLTVRSEEAAVGVVRQRRQRLSRDDRVRERRLDRLTAAEVREWLQGALQRADLGDDLLDFVLRHTEGNPFLVTQLMRTLVEEQAFTHDGTAWQWALPSSLALPAGMSDLVGRRLDRLPPEALRLLVTAAAIGRAFTVSLLGAAAQAPADAVLDAVDAGLAASVLEPVAGSGDDTYRFAHALLVDVVLGTVSPARQRLIHERIADLLAERTPDALDRIASHYARGSTAAKAYAWCLRAAERAAALCALDASASFLHLALGHAASDAERWRVHEELARVAELAGRWGDVERSCDAMLAIAGDAEQGRTELARALPVQQRRLQARLRLGQSTRQLERECRDLLAVAERIGAPTDVVRTRALLVQTLERLGRLDEAVQIAEASLERAEAHGEESLVAEALHRLAHTLLAVRAADAIGLLLRLIALARRRGDGLLEARAFLVLGVARMRTRDDPAGAEAFRTALELARDSQALDVAAGASMNLGVIELRRGEFAGAHGAFQEALRLYTTLRNNTNRLAALYNCADLEWERGDTAAAAALYRETAALAEQLGADDIAIGAHAGAGLAALRRHEAPAARAALAAAQRALGDRADWWFQGRERLESLVIRLAVQDGRSAEAGARFAAAVERLEAMDVYSAAWMVADCAADLAAAALDPWPTVDRFAEHGTVREFVPLAARFTALRDLEKRR
jgi:diguanylate cyclase (GGDEF)-like protein/putative nucleotidyltransferase with HDIG domain